MATSGNARKLLLQLNRNLVNVIPASNAKQRVEVDLDVGSVIGRILRELDLPVNDTAARGVVAAPILGHCLVAERSQDPGKGNKKKTLNLTK